MHGATLKTVSAQQANLDYNYKNTNLKLLQTNAAVRFNNMCKKIRLFGKWYVVKHNCVI